MFKTYNGFLQRRYNSKRGVLLLRLSFDRFTELYDQYSGRCVQGLYCIEVNIVPFHAEYVGGSFGMEQFRMF